MNEKQLFQIEKERLKLVERGRTVKVTKELFYKIKKEILILTHEYNRLTYYCNRHRVITKQMKAKKQIYSQLMNLETQIMTIRQFKPKRTGINFNLFRIKDKKTKTL